MSMKRYFRSKRSKEALFDLFGVTHETTASSAPITLILLLSGLLTSIPDHVFAVDYSMNSAILIGTCLIMIHPFAPSFF